MMWKKRKNFYQRGQTIVEISLVVLIVTGVLVAMTPMFKRGLQAMIKVAADQIGDQKGSDQNFQEAGSTTGMIVTSHIDSKKETDEDFGTVSYRTDESQETQTEQTMDYGVVKN